MEDGYERIIEEMNIALSKHRLGRRELYEYLIAKGIIEPNSELKFNEIFEWAEKYEYIDRTRVKRWNKKRGKLPKYFTKKQLVKIFETIDRPKDSIACFMALMCGLRINEISCLKIKDIDFENHRIFIRDSKNPNRERDNYGKDRYVDFDPAIDGIIKKWIEIIGETSEWFLPSDKSPDLHLRKKSVHERFRQYLNEAGLLHIDYTMKVMQKVNGKKIEKLCNRHTYYFHCFRHTMACIIYNKTSDIYVVNRFLGHRQIDTTTVYARMTDAKLKNTLSSVFASLQYNYSNGEHLPNPHPVRQGVHSSPIIPVTVNNAMELLETQFVNGDISEAEFLRRKKVLSASSIKKTVEINADTIKTNI
jgi:integrase